MTLPLRVVPPPPPDPAPVDLPDRPHLLDLPARPRLHPDRAVAWRGRSAVQVGLDPGAALLLDGLAPPLAALVRDLDGSRRPDELLADAVARGADPRVAAGLLTDLLDAGALLGTLERPAGTTVGAAVGAAVGTAAEVEVEHGTAGRAGAAVTVHGGGRVAVAVACLLAAAGVGRVRVRAEGAVAGADTGTGLGAGDVGRPRAEAAAAAVARAAGDPADGPAGPGMVSPRRPPDLVVLAGSEVIDPALLRTLTAAGRPHLPVRVREGVGVLGPLVLPGHGACLRCVELTRTDADPDWPIVAAQLAGRTSPAPLAVATAVAGLAVGQVLALLDARPGLPADPPLLGAVVELDPGRAQVRRHRVLEHPACPCASTSGTGSTAASRRSA